MNNRPSHVAHRELRAVFRTPKRLLGLAAIAGLLALSGPFDTYARLQIGPRLLYWSAVTFLTYGTGAALSVFLSHGLKSRLAPGLALGVTITVTALAITAVVVLINWAAFGLSPLRALGNLAFLAPVLASAAMILLLLHWADPAEPGGAEQPPQASEQTPELLSRLPFEKRGALISLSVQDHYVEVTTTQGSALVLMRLGDAIKETAGTPGLHIHRSHWVALDQLHAAERRADGGRVTLSDGRSLPISRSRMPQAKAAGLFPQ